MKFLRFNILCLYLSLISTVMFAQMSTGKLAGQVLDASTGEPLIGANIILENTQLGAATDVDGNYFILNITPGTYNAKFSYVGYGTKTIQQVRVVAGITYELNVELSSGIEMDEIVVSGKKFFEENATNTVKVVDKESINRLPVKGVENLASLQAGVVVAEGDGGADGNADVNVRGGRGGEVLYVVDGVPQNDSYYGGNYSQVSNAAIDQISFQIGGFEAKYGQAQSGIINVTTKTGSPKYNLYADALSSSFTDNYGYNLYTASLDGPIIPGNKNHTFFALVERGYFLDAEPSAIPVEIPSIGYYSDTKPNNSSQLWRFTGRSNHYLGDIKISLGINGNFRDRNNYIHSYVKNNSHHNPRQKDENVSLSGRLSHNLSNSAFYNVNVGYKTYKREIGDGVWFDDLQAYGDTAINKEINSQGSRVGQDNGLFFLKGRVNNRYLKQFNETFSTDLDFTVQIDKHLLEAGAGFSYNILRRYDINPLGVAIDSDELSYKERLAGRQPFFFGYDITRGTSDDESYETLAGLYQPVSVKPKNPASYYAYVQDRYELQDLVINFGLRFDYFDSQQDELRNEALPFIYGNPEIFDPADFRVKDPEFFISPRIGLGFPVTESTVFHAQYGKFIQPPTLQDMVTSVNNLNQLVKDGNFGVNTGAINSEITTQYEIGFRQVLGGNVGALNVTAFYKNIKGLVNNETILFQRTATSQRDRYYRPVNGDFGTVKGIALSLAVSRLSYFAVSMDYTYSISEGTGSSTSSNLTAAFRNDNGETPRVIAPLDFDQRHTGVVNVGFYVPENELGVFELTNVTLLFSFNSGRPYTPLLTQDITPGGESNLGETKGYVNSSYGPGSNRIDLKVEKSFELTDHLFITPYVWVENLLDNDNAVTVYRSTGSPYSTGYLNSSEGRAKAAQFGESYVQDYNSLEQDPTNFGIPRLIKLGVRIDFSNIGGI